MNTPPPPLDADRRGTSAGRAAQQPGSLLFHSTPAHEDVLNEIIELAYNSREIALLVGPQGIGKSSLIDRLQASLPDHFRLCRLDCNPMMHPDQLLNRLGRCIDVHPTSEDMTEALGQAFARLRQLGQIPVIMLDDAEQLPISSLITLMRLHEQQVESVPVCALILFAQPAIDRTLSTHQLHAMGTNRLVRLEMPVLSQEQTKDYVRHFLQTEGVDSSLELDNQQLNYIHRESGGLPGKVNDLVIRALRKPGLSNETPLIGRVGRFIREIPPLTATASAVLIALLILITLFQTQIDKLFNQPEPVQPQLADRVAPMAAPRPLESPSEAKPEHAKPLAQPLPLPPRAEMVQTPEPHQPEPSAAPPKTAISPGPIAEMSAPPETGDPSPKPVTVSREDNSSEASPPVTTEPRAKTAAWLLKQNPDAYSLQILAAGSEDAVKKFLQQHTLGRDVYYFESKRKGLPWFAVLHGIYVDRESAVAALKKLPESLRKAGAWPRALSSIQNDIRQAR